MYAAAFRLLHQREDDCTSQSGKTERGGRHSFIIKFAFPSSIVHLIKKKKREKREKRTQNLVSQPQQKKQKVPLVGLLLLLPYDDRDNRGKGTLSVLRGCPAQRELAEPLQMLPEKRAES